MTVFLTLVACLFAPVLAVSDRRQHGRHASGRHTWPWTATL